VDGGGRRVEMCATWPQPPAKIIEVPVEVPVEVEKIVYVDRPVYVREPEEMVRGKRSAAPSPYTLHPTPYTLHLAPFNLHRAP